MQQDIQSGSQQDHTNQLALRLGYWSALLMVVTFAVFTIAFIAIPLTGPLFVWHDLAGYLAYVRSGHTFFQDLARWMMLLFGPLVVILFASLTELVSGERKLLARIGLSRAGSFHRHLFLAQRRHVPAGWAWLRSRQHRARLCDPQFRHGWSRARICSRPDNFVPAHTARAVHTLALSTRTS